MLAELPREEGALTHPHFSDEAIGTQGRSVKGHVTHQQQSWDLNLRPKFYPSHPTVPSSHYLQSFYFPSQGQRPLPCLLGQRPRELMSHMHTGWLTISARGRSGPRSPFCWVRNPWPRRPYARDSFILWIQVTRSSQPGSPPAAGFHPAQPSVSIPLGSAPGEWGVAGKCTHRHTRTSLDPWPPQVRVGRELGLYPSPA